MVSSIVNYNKFSHPRFESKLTTLNWKIKLFISLLICTLIVIVIYLHDANRNKMKGKFKTKAPLLWEGPYYKEILIIHWTTFGRRTWPPTVFTSDNCSILKTGTTQLPPISRVFDKPCRITFDRKNLSESQAVVFFSSDFYRFPLDRPQGVRAQNQIWVWYNRESPIRTSGDLKEPRNYFNWAMTYRRNSDVYHPYGYIVLRNNSNSSSTPSSQSSQKALDNPPSNYNRKSLEMKSGLAAWIVTRCTTPSKRENVVKELQKYIPVDIFGNCGNKTCPQILQNREFYRCYKHLEPRYKFYLSFENSLCLDYITEKFYLALQYNMVPVVYGGGIDDQMDYSAVAPQNSFIDARKFKSPKELANYLIYLDNNDEEYLKYFEWKATYQVMYQDYGRYGSGWCNLCQRIYEQMEKGEEHVWNEWYSDLDTWWNYKSELNSSAQLSQLASQSKSAVSRVGQSFQFRKEKLKPNCVLPKDDFLPYRKYEKDT